MAGNRTFTMIKPDAVERDLESKIKDFFGKNFEKKFPPSSSIII